MAAFFNFCLIVLGTLSLAILISLKESGTPKQDSEFVQKYLSNPEVLKMLIEKKKNRTISQSMGKFQHKRPVKQDSMERKNKKFDKIMKKMKKEKEIVENKYVRRNRKIQEIFSKRLEKIKEYCARYKKGQKRGIHGIKPRASTKSFSLGKFVKFQTEAE